MNYFTTTFFYLLIIMALAVPGFLLKKFSLVSDKAVKDFSVVLLYVGTPFLIFASMMKSNMLSVDWKNILLCVLITLLIHALGIAICLVCTMKDKNATRRAITTFSSTFSNCGFLGIPLAMVIIPEELLAEALVYVTLYNVVFNMLTWVAGSLLFKSEQKTPVKKVLINSLLNPCSIAFIVALPVALTGINLIEVQYVGKFIEYLSALCVPVSMLVLGMRIANMKFTTVVKNGYNYLLSAIKLIVLPLITLGVVVLLDIWLNVGKAFILGITLMVAMPTAASTIAIAEQFKSDSLYAAENVVVTSTFALITVPSVLLLLSIL